MVQSSQLRPSLGFFFYGSSNSWRSSLTTISPVGTSWSSNRFVIGPLEPWSFFISANRISVLPKKSGGSNMETAWRQGTIMYPDRRSGDLKENYWPSGENWSRSNTVTQRTSCSRSFMKNWQLEFHFGFNVSCKRKGAKRMIRHTYCTELGCIAPPIISFL